MWDISSARGLIDKGSYQNSSMENIKDGHQIQPEEKILTRIYLIRNHKVMIDRDLASLYGVETRVLNQAVKRNIKRFPNDFMFQLSIQEFNKWKSQIVISNKEKMGLRKSPLAFTEQGIAMLSSVLNSETAKMVNIQIIRVFTKLRRMLESHDKILKRLEDLERTGTDHDKKIQLVFQYIKQIEDDGKQKKDYKERKKIGY